MTNLILSIIIPIYNGQDHLPTLFQSFNLISQINNIEFIFINDGSTDDSELIINNHLHKFKNARQIYQESSGLSIARNRGAKNSKSE